MRFARLTHEGRARFARLDGHVAHALSDAPWQGGHALSETWTYGDRDLLCPVVPSKIVCIGRNYAEHAKELGNDVPAEPLLFLKPPSSLVGPGDAVVLPPESSRVEHEAELAVVIGTTCRRVARDRALSFVFGYTCGLDVTARDLQKKDVQFTRGKGFDTFCPVGPWIESALDPSALSIQCSVNGVRRQNGTTAHMIFDVATIVSYVSCAMTLLPGDVILTGTPSGVGPLVGGDSLSMEISGIGTLAVTIRPFEA